MFGNETRDLAVWIIEIAENPDLRGACRDAGRFTARSYQVDAEPAFHGYPLVFVDATDLVRTSLYAVLASDTAVLVHEDHSLGRGINGACGTDFKTRRILALVALKRDKFLPECGEFSGILFLYPVEGMIRFESLLILAGDSTRMTSDTSRCVNSYSVMRHCRLLLTHSKSLHIESISQALFSTRTIISPDMV